MCVLPPPSFSASEKFCPDFSSFVISLKAASRRLFWLFAKEYNYKEMQTTFLSKLIKKFSPGAYLGVDIGTTSIKVAELLKTPKGLRLSNYGLLESYGHLERFNDAIQTSSLKLLGKETAEMLKLLIKKSKIKTKRAIASIPLFAAFTILLEVPSMSSEEITQSMQFQARQYIPLPINEMALEWIKVGEYTDEKGFSKQQIFLISIPNDTIGRYKDIFNSAGLNLEAIELENISLTRALIGGDLTPTAILDIGCRASSVSIVDGGFVKAVHQSDYGGGNLTQAIAGGLRVNPKRAEELKRQRGLLGTRGEYELSTLMTPFLDVIINEVRRAANSYFEKYARKVERVIISGGGVALPGIVEYAERQLGLPVIKSNPLAGSRIAYSQELTPLIEGLGSSFSVALGLAMKELI